MSHEDAVRPAVAWVRRQLARSSVVIVAVAAFAIGLACAPGSSNQNATNGNAPANTSGGGTPGSVPNDWPIEFTPNNPTTLRIEWSAPTTSNTDEYLLEVKEGNSNPTVYDSTKGPKNVDLQAGVEYKLTLKVVNGCQDYRFGYRDNAEVDIPPSSNSNSKLGKRKVFIGTLVHLCPGISGKTFSTPVGIVMIEK